MLAISSFAGRYFLGTRSAESIILFGYLVNIVPFAAIDRSMYLYHYLPTLIFAILAIGLLLDRVQHRRVFAGALLLTGEPDLFISRR